MRTVKKARLLRLHFGEGDQYNGKPLYEAIVDRCREMQIAGATVLRGLEGYGESAEIHRSHVVRKDRPIVVNIVDTAENVARLIPVLEEMMDTGMIAASDVEYVRIERPPAVLAAIVCLAGLWLLTAAPLSAQKQKGKLESKGSQTMSFSLTVKGFDNGGAVPKPNTCDGGDSAPALEWSNEPAGTQGFALVLDDPDAPGGTWNHWLLWDIPAHVHSLPAGFTPGMLGASGKNDFGRSGYGGPCPPKGHGAHRYYFTLYAVDRAVLGLPPGSKRAELDRALNGRVLARAQYMGRYGRQ
jgi:Raf kinase inhibitor-like YbhB/YbcL family protein